MMRKTIVRTMATSTITAFALHTKDGAPVVENLEPITVMGKASEKEALKSLKEVYGKDVSISIGKIEVTEDTYEISVDEFLKHAKKVDKSKAEEN